MTNPSLLVVGGGWWWLMLMVDGWLVGWWVGGLVGFTWLAWLGQQPEMWK